MGRGWEYHSSEAHPPLEVGLHPPLEVCSGRMVSAPLEVGKGANGTAGSYPGMLFCVWQRWTQGVVHRFCGAVGVVEDGADKTCTFILSAILFLKMSNSFLRAVMWRPGC